ncbi:MAG TPA: peptide deformylase [Candidatus Deferrimicrobiaceae bacterium]|jgi:peptide deformylase
MAILPILIFPDPVLKEVARKVERFTPELSLRVDDLVETMRAMPGGVGIAAPQVGWTERVVIVDVSQHKKGGKQENHGLLELVNPEILAMGGSQVVREGCMSVPDYTANVVRAQWVLVDAFDRHGEQVILEALGFEAVVLQHELDHLDGLLFLDRVSSLKSDLFRRKSYR